MPSILHMLRQCQTRAIAGFLVSPPCYIRPSQGGIVDYFTRLANESALPLILYNIPYRTGVGMTLETIRTLAQHENIVAIKDCGGDSQLTMQLIADSQLDVLAGEDHQLFSTLCLGGTGAIAASANIRPDLHVRIERLLRGGQLQEARQLFLRLLPMIQLLFSEPNPAPVKALLAATGEIRNELRMPMQSASSELTRRLREIWMQLPE